MNVSEHADRWLFDCHRDRAGSLVPKKPAKRTCMAIDDPSVGALLQLGKAAR